MFACAQSYKNWTFTMILFTNLYENYTIASSNRFLMSVKVQKRCNNQMIEYIKFHNARQ